MPANSFTFCLPRIVYNDSLNFLESCTIGALFDDEANPNEEFVASDLAGVAPENLNSSSDNIFYFLSDDDGTYS